MVWFFTFFLVSGFCSILYEIVWLRLAMAQFGVTTALASIVISVFMAGLGLGSWGSGRLIRSYESRVNIPPLRFYALAELLVGISALLVPVQLLWGRKLLEWTGASSSWAYYLGFGLSASRSPWFRGAPAWARPYLWPCSRSAAANRRALAAIIQLSLPVQRAGRGHRSNLPPAAD